jgi:hypothetical protein
VADVLVLFVYLFGSCLLFLHFFLRLHESPLIDWDDVLSAGDDVAVPV